MPMTTSSAGSLSRAICAITCALLSTSHAALAQDVPPPAPVKNVSGRLTEDAVLSQFEINGTKYCVEVKLAAIARLTTAWQDYAVTPAPTNRCEQAPAWYVAPNNGLPDRPVSFFNCAAAATSCVRVATTYRALVGAACTTPVVGTVRGDQWMKVGTYDGRDGFALCEYR